MQVLKKRIFKIIILLFFQINIANACTNFCMDTPKGPIFGSNLDLLIPGDGLGFINRKGISKKGLYPGTTGKTINWVSKFGSVSFNMGGREMAFGGMNETGLVLSTMELLAGKFPEKDERSPLFIALWAQYVLDTCKSIDDVINVDKKVRIEDNAPPQHYMISDAEGNCVVIEWLDGKSVIHSGESLPAKALSNSIYNRALAIYKRGGPHWWESDRGKTNRRFARAAKRNIDFKTSGEPNAIKYAFETLTKKVAEPNTKWNIVYDIKQRQVFFRSEASPTLKYFSFKDFDFSCSAPSLMLDINFAIEGDVSKYFIPYDYNINLKIFKTLCDRYNLNVSLKAAEDLVKHLESFKCSD